MSLTARPTVDVNLCAGAGGLALGLTQAGFAPSELYDQNKSCCETLRHNIAKDSNILNGRVFEGDLKQVEWVPGSQSIRLLAAGVPCQPFSLGGNHRGHHDNRNLFPNILEAVRLLRPQAVLIENVRGLNRQAHYPYLDYILDQLRYPDVTQRPGDTWKSHADRLLQHSHGRHSNPDYNVVSSVFNAADFGVAQIRHRLFIVATDISLPEYKFPTPTHSKWQLQFEQATGYYWASRSLHAPPIHRRTLPNIGDAAALLPWVTVRDAINSLPHPDPKESQSCNNHWTIAGARRYPGHTGSSLDQPSKTLKAGVHGLPGGENMMVLDDGSVRYYTLREMARLQSFPDTHYFLGARSNVVRQIGNAVPCTLAYQVAKPLRQLFDGKSKTQKKDQRS